MQSNGLDGVPPLLHMGASEDSDRMLRSERQIDSSIPLLQKIRLKARRAGVSVASSERQQGPGQHTLPDTSTAAHNAGDCTAALGGSGHQGHGDWDTDKQNVQADWGAASKQENGEQDKHVSGPALSKAGADHSEPETYVGAKEPKLMRPKTPFAATGPSGSIDPGQITGIGSWGADEEADQEHLVMGTSAKPSTATSWESEGTLQGSPEVGPKVVELAMPSPALQGSHQATPSGPFKGQVSDEGHKPLPDSQPYSPEVGELQEVATGGGWDNLEDEAWGTSSMTLAQPEVAEQTAQPPPSTAATTLTRMTASNTLDIGKHKHLENGLSRECKDSQGLQEDTTKLLSSTSPEMKMHSLAYGEHKKEAGQVPFAHQSPDAWGQPVVQPDTMKPLPAPPPTKVAKVGAVIGSDAAPNSRQQSNTDAEDFDDGWGTLDSKSMVADTGKHDNGWGALDGEFKNDKPATLDYLTSPAIGSKRAEGNANGRNASAGGVLCSDFVRMYDLLPKLQNAAKNSGTGTSNASFPGYQLDQTKVQPKLAPTAPAQICKLSTMRLKIRRRTPIPAQNMIIDPVKPPDSKIPPGKVTLRPKVPPLNFPMDSLNPSNENKENPIEASKLQQVSDLYGWDIPTEVQLHSSTSSNGTGRNTQQVHHAGAVSNPGSVHARQDAEDAWSQDMAMVHGNGDTSQVGVDVPKGAGAGMPVSTELSPYYCHPCGTGISSPSAKSFDLLGPPSPRDEKYAIFCEVCRVWAVSEDMLERHFAKEHRLRHDPRLQKGDPFPLTLPPYQALVAGGADRIAHAREMLGVAERLCCGKRWRR